MHFLKREQNPSYLVFLRLKKDKNWQRLSLCSNEAGAYKAHQDVHSFLRLSKCLGGTPPSGNTSYQSVSVGGDRLKHLHCLQAALAHEGSLAAAHTLPSSHCPPSRGQLFLTNPQPELVPYSPGTAAEQATFLQRRARLPEQRLLFCRSRLGSTLYRAILSNPDLLS